MFLVTRKRSQNWNETFKSFTIISTTEYCYSISMNQFFFHKLCSWINSFVISFAVWRKLMFPTKHAFAGTFSFQSISYCGVMIITLHQTLSVFNVNQLQAYLCLNSIVCKLVYVTLHYSGHSRFQLPFSLWTMAHKMLYIQLENRSDPNKNKEQNGLCSLHATKWNNAIENWF